MKSRNIAKAICAFFAPFLFLSAVFYAPEAYLYKFTALRFYLAIFMIIATGSLTFFFYDNDKKPQGYRVVAGLLYGLLAAWFCLQNVPGDGNVFEHFSKSEFKAQRELVLKDPNLFPAMKAIAAQYNVDLVLGDAGESWALTKMVATEISSAYMAVRSGYCELGFDQDGVLTGLHLSTDSNSKALIAAVMAHELGHCLDIRRDFAHLVTDHRMETYSIAPQDRQNVAGIESYLQAEQKNATKLWREAYADIFAVGFIDLHYNSDRNELITRLRQHREGTKSIDKIHATMCWIDLAKSATPPTNDKELQQWADIIRRSAHCALPNT